MQKNLIILLITLLLHTSIAMRGRPSKKLASSPVKEFKILQKNDGYYLPVKIGNADFQLRLSGNSVPSWMILGKGEFCLLKDSDHSCQRISTKVKCDGDCQRTPLDPKNQKFIIDGCEITAKGRVSLKYALSAQKDINQKLTGGFLDASKITVKLQGKSNIGDTKLGAIINVRDWNSFTIRQRDKEVFLAVEQKDFSKQGKVISVGIADGNQDFQQSDKMESKWYIVANQEQKTKIVMPKSKIRFDFVSQSDYLLSFPLTTAKSLSKLLQKTYLESKCKLQPNGIILQCKRKPVLNNMPIDICQDQRNCLRVNADSLISKIGGKKFKLMFATSQEDNQIVLSGQFLGLYSLAFVKGEIKQIVKNADYQLVSLVSDSGEEKEQENRQNAEENDEIAIPKAKSRQEQLAHNKKSILATIMIVLLLYCVIAVVVLALVKRKSKNSLVGKTIAFAFGAISGYFNRMNGYHAPQMGSEIDDQNSFSYQKESRKGKKMFWEKNSLEGI